MILQPIVEPRFFRVEADQHAGRPAMACDDNLLLRRQPQVAREIIFHLRQSYPLHLACLPWRARLAPVPWGRWRGLGLLSWGCHKTLADHQCAADTEAGAARAVA